MKLFDWIRRGKPEAAPAAEPVRKEPGMTISLQAVANAEKAVPKGEFKRPAVMPGVIPPERELAMLAMDSAMAPTYAYVSEAYAGMGFIGYPYLAELSQRPEYRKMSDVIAKEMTRKWIKLETSGDDDKTEKLQALDKAMRRFKLRARFRLAALQDGLYGRSQIYIDVKTPKGAPAWSDPEELKSILVRAPAKITKGSLLGFKVIDPVWTTPYLYNSDNPMRADFYKPTSWFVLGRDVHCSRLLNIVSREVPDLLKPSYNFGGLSMTQLAIPYVNNWLKTRESIANLIDGFSVPVLSTNLASILSGDCGDDVFNRLALFNRMRSNRGAWAINKETEEFKFENVPLSGLDALQGQSQEQMSSVSSIPLVKLLGITPSGLNASSDGEIRVFYDDILSVQESVFRDPIQACLEVIQLSEFGEIDPDITFSFVPLWQLSEKEQAEVRKMDADADAVLIGASVISPDDARERVAADPTNGYHALETNPDPDVDLEDDEEEPDPDGDPGGLAADGEFREGDHPRDASGKFGSGGGSSQGSAVRLKGDELGEFSSMKELRQKAMAYADSFIGKTFTNESTGNAIQVSKSGVKHTLSNSGDELVRTVPAIPALIERSQLVDSTDEKGGDPNIVAVETYEAPLELDGKQHRAIMTVKCYQDGRRYYDHGLVK